MTEIMEFFFKAPLTIIDETVGKPMVVECTLLAEGITKNGRLYTLSELKNVAEEAMGKPVYYGTDPFMNEHTNPLRGYSEVPQIGKVIKSWLDESARKVKAHIEITKEELKSIIRTLGISIGGWADKVIHLFKGGQRIWQVIGAKIDHIQLIPAGMPRGVEEAKVENVIEESFLFPMIDSIETILMPNIEVDLSDVPEKLREKLRFEFSIKK